MKVYLLSLGAGALVGIAYSLMRVRSPAPPVVALVGLLGMLLGEQIVPTVRSAIGGGGATVITKAGPDDGERHRIADDLPGDRR